MKVIICGAGQVGFNIARYLAAKTPAVPATAKPAEWTRR